MLDGAERSISTAMAISTHSFSFLMSRYAVSSELYERWAGQLVAVLIVSLLLAIWAARLTSQRERAVLLLLRATLVILSGVPLQSRILVQLPLMMSIAFDAGLSLTPYLALFIGASTILWISNVQGETVAWGYGIAATSHSDILLMQFLSTFTLLLVCVLASRARLYASRADRLALTARSATELSRVNLKLQQYSADVERQAMSNERKRLTREIHDTVGYVLMNQITLMEVASRLLDRLTNNRDAISPKCYEELQRILRRSHLEAKNGLSDVRQILHELRRMQRDKQVTAIDRIRKLVAAYKNTPISISLKLSNTGNETFTDEIDYILFRTVQEGITNALRHGNATFIEIVLAQDDASVAVAIVDNGLGAAKIEEGIGLAGIRERIERIQGDVQMRTSTRGFELHVRLPWEKQKQRMRR